MWSLVLEKMRFHHMIGVKRGDNELYHDREGFSDEGNNAISGERRWLLWILIFDVVGYQFNLSFR